MRLYDKVVVSVVALLLVLGVARSLYQVGAATPTLSNATTLPVIVIDPGHGGVDGGAVGVDNIVEKDINLKICMVMKDIFTASGFDVVMTRETDISIHDEGITSVRKQKTSDLHNRLAIAEQYPGAIFISLHQNKFTSSNANGTQIFYGPKNEQSKVLAQILQDNFKQALQPENSREIKKAEKNLYLMDQAKCISVLVECGFLSNPKEAYQLIDPTYQAQIAFEIYHSVMEYLSVDIPTLPEESSMHA